jgi:hypothetical protein
VSRTPGSPLRPPRTALGWLLAALSLAPSAARAQGDSARVLRAIEIHRQEVFDSAEARRNWLARAANNVHVRTRLHTIERELLIRAGEPYDTLLAFETVQNLRGLGIFRQVRLDTVQTDSGLVVRITARDAWTTRADARFRSTGQQADWQVSFFEDNLLGAGTRIGARYRKTPDRTLTTIQLAQRRLIADRIGVDLRYETRSDGERQRVIVSQPFFSVKSRFGFELQAERLDERVLRFREGQPEPADTLWRRYRLGRMDVSAAVRATSGGYFRVGLTALVRRDDYADLEAGPFGDDVIGTGGPFAEWRRADFRTTRRFLGLGRDEETLDLSTTVRTGLLLAPEAFGYREGGLGGFVLFHQGVRTPGGFTMFDITANGLFTAAGLDTGSVFVAGTVAVQPSETHLMVLHTQAGWIQGPRPGSEYDFGLAQGPRAFKAHAFTGDRALLATVEYRVVIPREVLGIANLGVAAFADHGGAWFGGSPARFGSSFGVGLRFGVSRSASLNPNRFDIAYRPGNDADPSGVVISIGRGLPFSTNPRP